MRIYNPATDAYADVPPKAFGVWSNLGWRGADEDLTVPPVAPEQDEDEDAAEKKTAAAHGPRRANQSKDK